MLLHIRCVSVLLVNMPIFWCGGADKHPWEQKDSTEKNTTLPLYKQPCSSLLEIFSLHLAPHSVDHIATHGSQTWPWSYSSVLLLTMALSFLLTMTKALIVIPSHDHRGAC